MIILQTSIQVYLAMVATRFYQAFDTDHQSLVLSRERKKLKREMKSQLRSYDDTGGFADEDLNRSLNNTPTANNINDSSSDDSDQSATEHQGNNN